MKSTGTQANISGGMLGYARNKRRAGFQGAGVALTNPSYELRARIASKSKEKRSIMADQDILAEAREAFKDACEAEDDNRRDALADLR
jgi:hypothetical protein